MGNRAAVFVKTTMRIIEDRILYIFPDQFSGH